MKDLEISPYVPSPNTSVSTWIDMVDMRIQGAEVSRRGGWTDKELYYMLGNKLKESAAEWHVDMHRQLQRRRETHHMTWTYLKKQLLLRFGERLNRAQAEWRVRHRYKLDAEGYMTYASQLRKLVGRNRVSERVLLDQFYEQLPSTVLESVRRRRPLPRTIEEAARRASKYDRHEPKRIAQAMRRLGQQWAEAPARHRGGQGDPALIPGVSARQTEAIQQRVREVASDDEYMEDTKLPIITNQGGVYNPATAVWEVPPNFEYSGGAWAPKKRVAQGKKAREDVSFKADRKRKRDEHGGRYAKRAKVSKAMGKQRRQAPRSDSDSASSEDEGSENWAGPDDEDKKTQRPPKLTRREVATDQASQVAFVQQAVATAMREHGQAAKSTTLGTEMRCFNCGDTGHMAGTCARGTKCYACNGFGHMARNCPDEERRHRNEEYMRTRAERIKAQPPVSTEPGNGGRT